MIDALSSFVRLFVSTVGLVALPDAAALGVAGAVALVVVSVVALVIATIGAVVPGATGSPRRHPTRDSELTAPLTQSDPDAAGHVRRRGPGAVLSAA